MTCDGSPGNPGTETVPSDDGPDKLACLGCSVCKPWNYAPFRNTVDVPEGMRGRADLEEAVRGLAWAREHPDAFKNEHGWVPCRSTARGPGCGHNTLEHTGPKSVNSDCDCCTWRQAPLPHAGVVTEPKVELHDRASTKVMDAQAAVYALGSMGDMNDALSSLQKPTDDVSGLLDALMTPHAALNRAQRRRLAGKGGGRATGNLPPRRRHRG
jgi:hypothetical protein